jgi:purine-nucleoside phosphorylase
MYEGYSAQDAVYALRVMGCLGVRKVVLTNAAGSVRIERRPGDAMLLADHINLTGQNCLIGSSPDFGPQFVDMVNAYDRQWRERIETQTRIHSGVYVGLMGPNYETPAETRMLGQIGGDVVGMSTVQETIAARQMGMKVAALSLITNYAGGLSDAVNHQEVLETGKQRSHAMVQILQTAIAQAPE